MQDENIRKDEVIALKETKTDISEEANKAMMELLKAKKAEIDETLAQVEKRNKEFRELVDEMKMSGKGSAGKAEQSEEDKAKDAARKLIAGTGLERMADI